MEIRNSLTGNTAKKSAHDFMYESCGDAGYVPWYRDTTYAPPLA